MLSVLDVRMFRGPKIDLDHCFVESRQRKERHKIVVIYNKKGFLKDLQTYLLRALIRNSI